MAPWSDQSCSRTWIYSVLNLVICWCLFLVYRESDDLAVGLSGRVVDVAQGSLQFPGVLCFTSYPPSRSAPPPGTCSPACSLSHTKGTGPAPLAPGSRAMAFSTFLHGHIPDPSCPRFVTHRFRKCSIKNYNQLDG